MTHKEQIEASIRRLAAREIEKISKECGATLSRYAAKQMIGSSGLVLSVEEACRAGFDLLANAAAVQLAEIEGENAPQHADLLNRVLSEVQPEILDIFMKRAAPGSHSGRMPMAIVPTRQAALADAMGASGEGIVSDLRLGIAGGVNVKKQKTGVSIDNRGGAGQFNIGSPGATQTVRGNQVATSGIDPALFADLLLRVRQEVDMAGIASATKDEIEDAIVNAEREVSATAPNPGRVARLLRAVASRLESFGINVAAGMVVAYLQRNGLA